MKSVEELYGPSVPGVAPRAGAWIEIVQLEMSMHVLGRRSPCGSVD
ncbi:hypothetical protein M3223_13760 [Paenibacillus pasadenensis]|nr:hypothetical protein [Paenibacillus pasadenensis]MCM3748412.1 hypothetical protein [Paenibacillus pasadenensis]